MVPASTDNFFDLGKIDVYLVRKREREKKENYDDGCLKVIYLLKYIQ